MEILYTAVNEKAAIRYTGRPFQTWALQAPVFMFVSLNSALQRCFGLLILIKRVSSSLSNALFF